MRRNNEFFPDIHITIVKKFDFMKITSDISNQNSFFTYYLIGCKKIVERKLETLQKS